MDAGVTEHVNGDTDPLDEEVCRQGDRPEKLDKTYPSIGPTARRKGLTPVLTTLFNVHEREALTVFKNRKLVPELVDQLFRCRGFAYETKLDPRLLETVLDAAEHFESPRVNIISAYRSPKFNDALAKKGRHVARESRHTKGEALDFSLTTVRAEELGKWLWEVFDGGLGTYRDNNFVHIDVGPKRRWRGR